MGCGFRLRDSAWARAWVLDRLWLYFVVDFFFFLWCALEVFGRNCVLFEGIEEEIVKSFLKKIEK